MYAMTGLYAESGCVDGAGDEAGSSAPPQPSHPPRESIKCHSRNPSAGICDRYTYIFQPMTMQELIFKKLLLTNHTLIPNKMFLPIFVTSLHIIINIFLR